jgi:transcriptional regulator with XRE-family HTH domain
MTGEQWRNARMTASLRQVETAQSLGVSQAYLSQLENGSRRASPDLAQRAAVLYRLPTAMPLPQLPRLQEVGPDDLQRELAGLGYPGFAHVSAGQPQNPARVVFDAIVQRDLDTRLVEALPWVMSKYPDLNWGYLRDQVKLRNAQNRLGYVVHLAKSVVGSHSGDDSTMQTLSCWERDLEEARLAVEGTLCRESMPQRERVWLREHRSPAAMHWNLLTGLTTDQLSYAP